MRACGSCRRRKIKCDAATTNSWPCAACVKQQLECVPPSSDQDGDSDWIGPKSAGLPPTKSEPLNHFDAGSYHRSLNSTRRASFTMASSQPLQPSVAAPNMAQWNPYGLGSYPFAQNPLVDQLAFPLQKHQEQSASISQPAPKSPSATSVGTWSSDRPDGDLSDAFQDLKIDLDGIG